MTCSPKVETVGGNGISDGRLGTIGVGGVVLDENFFHQTRSV